MAFTSEQDAGRNFLRVVTFGLQPFIGREVECFTASLPAATMAEWLIELSDYLVRHGAVIEDNDLRSLTPQDMVRASYRPEGQRPGVPIIQFDMDDTAAPQGDLGHAAVGSVRAQADPRMVMPEPMPVEHYDAPARRQRAVFGKRGTVSAAALPPLAAQTKGPARWPGLRLFGRK
jgi:hypothetical protein